MRLCVAHRSGRALAVLAIGAATIALAACGGSASSKTLAGTVRTQPLQVGSVTLPDVTGGANTAFTMAAKPGRLLIAYFGYTSCPDVCPTTLADLKLAFNKIGAAADAIDVAFVTIDPARDTSEVLTKYLQSFLPRARALRATDSSQLAMAETAFSASSSVVTSPSGQIEVSHSAVTYVVDTAGTVIDEWVFPTSRDVMAHDLEILLPEYT